MSERPRDLRIEEQEAIMTEEDREAFRRVTSEACDAFMRRIGEKYPWMHPDFDPRCRIWRERAVRAWNRSGRRPTLY
jgi:hypothetical protein